MFEGPLTDLIVELLMRSGEVELHEFMDMLFEECWRRGVICLKWKIEVDGDRIRRLCTDAWEIVKALERRGIVRVDEVGGRRIIKVVGSRAR